MQKEARPQADKRWDYHVIEKHRTRTSISVIITNQIIFIPYKTILEYSPHIIHVCVQGRVLNLTRIVYNLL